MISLGTSDKSDEKISLVNKIVKTRNAAEGIDNTGIIPFMYPDFLVKDELFFDYKNSVIIETAYSPTLKLDLKNATARFIAICDSGFPDVDFTDRSVIIQVLKDKYWQFGKNKIDVMMDMEEEDFWKEFKKQWVRNTGKDFEKETSMYQLFMVLGKSAHEVFNVYFKLRRSYSDSVILSSVLSFIDKSLHPDKVSSNNGKYLKLLREFRENLGNKEKECIQMCYRLRDDTEMNLQYKTMYLLRGLSGGKVL